MTAYSDPGITDDMRRGDDLIARIEELTQDHQQHGHGWRPLLVACRAEILRLRQEADDAREATVRRIVSVVNIIARASS